MLCGAKGICDEGYVAYDHSLAPARITWVLAHELSHVVLHAGRCQCVDPELVDDPIVDPLPYGIKAVGEFNPRQRRELEANAFAAAYLLPPNEVRHRFLSGVTMNALLDEYGVSTTATLHGIADALLRPHALAAPQLAHDGAFSLDSDQDAAAAIARGPVLVDAGPGTGKTRTLVGRVRHLLADGVPAEQILAISFSNRAANEMRERLSCAATSEVHALTICTIHALCLELLRRYHPLVDLPANFTVIDEIDAEVLLERNVARLPLEHYFNVADPGFHFKALIKAISSAKDELASPRRYAELAEQQRLLATDDAAMLRAERWAEVANVYAIYEELLREHGVIDFGGLVMRAEELLHNHPPITAALRAQWPHILVDEYQDMNRASGRLLQHLAGDGCGLWVVGDLRQAIYRFRGASPANIAKFASDFPGGRTLNLGINYRSDPQLVALFTAAGSAMSHSDLPAPTWQSYWPREPPPRIWEAVAEDDQAEAAGIAAEIMRRRTACRSLRDQAVLVRTHAQAQVIVAALEAADVPALYLGNLFGREEVRDLLAVMSLAAEGDGTALLRVGAMPEHAMPRAERVQLIRFARDQGAHFPDALALAAPAGLGVSAVETARNLLSVIKSIGWQVTPWQFLARYLFGHGGLVRRLAMRGDAQAAQQLLAIRQLLAIAQAFAERPLGGDREGERAIKSFLSHIRRLAATEDRVARLPAGMGDFDAARVLTIHAAKGLEFPVVYLTNLAETRFPGRPIPNTAPPPPGLADEHGDTDAEAEALFFVAISRAKQELILTRASRYGKTLRAPSPLLALVEPFFSAEPPEQLTWEAAPLPANADAAEPPTDLGGLHVAGIEHYMRCPRQFAYRHILALHGRDDELGYKRYQRAMYRVLAELRERHRRGEPGEPDDVQAVLTTEWERSGPGDHPYEPLYRKLAETIVHNTWRQLGELSRSRTWRSDVQVEVGGMKVRIPIDASSIDPDGSVRISRIHVRPRKGDDHTARSLALLRAGALNALDDGAQVAIQLEYPATGEIVEVKENKRYEPARIAKLERAIGGITRGEFPAQPENPKACLRCPFWMVCPA